MPFLLIVLIVSTLVNLPWFSDDRVPLPVFELESIHLRFRP